MFYYTPFVQIKNVKTKDRTNRNLWVQFLLDRAQKTRDNIFTDQVLAKIENDTVHIALNSRCASDNEVKHMIADVLTFPNPTWLQKSEYTIEKSFFD